MYIRLIDSTHRENENLFRLNDQQKVYYSSWWLHMQSYDNKAELRKKDWVKTAVSLLKINF